MAPVSILVLGVRLLPSMGKYSQAGKPQLLPSVQWDKCSPPPALDVTAVVPTLISCQEDAWFRVIGHRLRAPV